MSPNLFDLLHRSDEPLMSGRLYGVVTGIVTDNRDPAGLGRVKVRFPWLSDENESAWARIAVPMAGDTRGVYLLPEQNDEVLVAFEQGDVNFPYVLGALWSRDQKPPESNAGGQNNRRTLTSRSGHVIRLDDSSGAEKIEIIDKTGHNSIIVDAATNTISIKAQGDITLESSGGRVIIKGVTVELN